jgi:hypothetical protein
MSRLACPVDIGSLTSQGPGCARPGGACPRFAAGRAATTTGDPADYVSGSSFHCGQPALRRVRPLVRITNQLKDAIGLLPEKDRLQGERASYIAPRPPLAGRYRDPILLDEYRRDFADHRRETAHPHPAQP